LDLTADSIVGEIEDAVNSPGACAGVSEQCLYQVTAPELNSIS